ncbi:hypothetical protein GBAR_LOCUS18582 [Geodia barretti]|uniref:Uncharacterized protein n=1 Tax=Geodia barretti TaxID=519541 RepID=A0AA35WY08_GEOBA|nr:hypothetical protein GBAR_LOCUS18582 [Geodia barretti]
MSCCLKSVIRNQKPHPPRYHLGRRWSLQRPLCPVFTSSVTLSLSGERSGCVCRY